MPQHSKFFWGTVGACTPPLEVEIGGSPDHWCIHNALVTACVFLQRAQTAPLSEQEEVLFPSNSVLLPLFSQGEGEGSVAPHSVAQDKANGKSGDGTASCSLLWLNRAMQFLVKFVEELASDPKITLIKAVNNAYDTTLKPYHSRTVQWTIWAVLKGLPHRDYFEQKMAAGEPLPGPALEFVKAFSPLVDEVHRFLDTNGLNDKGVV